MSRKLAEETVQTAFRLPKDLHERLKAAGGERGFGEEVRRRLEASFHPHIDSVPPRDPKTAGLLAVIPEFASQVADDWGQWHATTAAFEIFKAGLDHALEQSRPQAVLEPKPDSFAAIIMHEGDSNNLPTVGKILMRIVLKKETN